MVKVLLMYTAQQIAGANTLEQGAGEINIEGAVRLARLVRADLSPLTLPGAPLLTTSTLPAPRSTVGGQAFTWSQGIIMDRTFATGSNLITKYQKVYATGTILNDGVMTGDGILKCNLTLMSSGVMLADQILTSNGITMSEGVNFLGTDMLGGDGVMLADGVMVSDGVMLGDGVMTGDGVMLGDSLMQALSSMINGDATLNMSVEMDDGSNYTGY